MLLIRPSLAHLQASESSVISYMGSHSTPTNLLFRLITFFWILLWVYPFFLQPSQNSLQTRDNQLAMLIHLLPSRITSSTKPTSISSTNAPHERGNSVTFHCLNDPSPLDSSEECKTITFLSEVRDFHPQAHSRQDRFHHPSSQKHSWPFNMQASQCSLQPLDMECYQWNKFETYGHFP